MQAKQRSNKAAHKRRRRKLHDRIAETFAEGIADMWLSRFEWLLEQ